MPSYLFSKPQRLLNASDFTDVFTDPPLRASHKHLLILAKPNGKPLGRLGLVIAKKNIRLAVQRNRIKRLIRESFRQQQHYLVGIDAIVLARKGLDQLDNQQLFAILNQQWLKIRKKSRQQQALQPE